MDTLVERYCDRIVGVLSCFDRVVIQGTLTGGAALRPLLLGRHGLLPADGGRAPLRLPTVGGSLGDLRGLMAAANRRYLEFISALEDPSGGTKALQKVAAPASENGRNYRGFNFFSTDDDIVLSAILRGEFTISGLRNKDLRSLLHDKKPGWTSRCLKRLRVHGLVKRIGRTYKYYVTELGRRVVLTGLKLREMVIIPALAQSSKALATG